MKKIIIITLLFGSYNLIAQIIPVENFKQTSLINNQKPYFKDINGVYNKFLGNWIYQTTQDFVEIKIYKRENQDSGNYYVDEIYILIKYTKNGNVVYNTLYTLQGSRVYIVGSTIKDENNLELFYSEPDVPIREQTADLYLEYFTENGEQKLKWHIEYVSTTPDPLPFKMPYAMVLTKVN